MTDPSAGQSTTAVEVSAARAAAGAPVADLGGDLAAGLILQGGAGLGTCEATFDLGNGITGTCSESPEGTFNFAFSGTTNVGGRSTTVDGTMVATSGATGVTIDLDATATWSGGSATVAVNGTITPGSGGGLGTVALTVQVTVDQTGRSAVSGTFLLTPNGMSFSASNGGVLVGVAFNRETMTGTATVGGVVVANISVQNGCAVIDFVDPTSEDRTVCPD
ncbi:MAG TPA: hypothetical protein VF139_13810 [Candidatus Polarisedimenticolaceae bacterium]